MLTNMLVFFRLRVLCFLLLCFCLSNFLFVVFRYVLELLRRVHSEASDGFLSKVCSLCMLLNVVLVINERRALVGEPSVVSKLETGNYNVVR